MRGGLQTFDASGKIVFDSSVHRIVSFLGEFNIKWTVVRSVWENSIATRKVYRGDFSTNFAWSSRDSIIVYSTDNQNSMNILQNDGYLTVDAIISKDAAAADKLPTTVKILRF